MGRVTKLIKTQKKKKKINSPNQYLIFSLQNREGKHQNKYHYMSSKNKILIDLGRSAFIMLIPVFLILSY